MSSVGARITCSFTTLVDKHPLQRITAARVRRLRTHKGTAGGAAGWVERVKYNCSTTVHTIVEMYRHAQRSREEKEVVVGGKRPRRAHNY
jgi:hypothetical protein